MTSSGSGTGKNLPPAHTRAKRATGLPPPGLGGGTPRGSYKTHGAAVSYAQPPPGWPASFPVLRPSAFRSSIKTGPRGATLPRIGKPSPVSLPLSPPAVALAELAPGLPPPALGGGSHGDASPARRPPPPWFTPPPPRSTQAAGAFTRAPPPPWGGLLCPGSSPGPRGLFPGSQRKRAAWPIRPGWRDRAGVSTVRTLNFAPESPSGKWNN